MFKANIINVNENLEEKINPVFIDMDNIQNKNLKEYINPWADIRDYISSSPADKITKYILNIPDEYKNRFFPKYYNKIGLEFLVVPENQFKNKDTHNSLYNLIKQQNFPFVRSKDFYKKLDKIKLDQDTIKNYKYVNGDVKYLIANTLFGYYFISKQDIERFSRNPTDFLSIVKPLVYKKEGNNIKDNYLNKDFTNIAAEYK